MVLLGEPAGVPAGVPTEAEVLRRARGENFPVASRLLLGRQRDHLVALYGFARLVDELGDGAGAEGPAREGAGKLGGGDRMALLDWADAQVDQAVAGVRTAGGGHPVFSRLAVTIGACRLPAEPFHDLVQANRRDQHAHRYATFEELLGYCRLSANPVGRLVLAVFGVDGAEELALADAVCTGLQLVEHWQDVAEDAGAGRIYLPLEDMERFGVTQAEILAAGTGAGSPGGPASPPLRELLAFETRRARGLLETGGALVGRLRGRPRLAVAGFVAGGLAAAEALEACRYEVLAGAPRPRKTRLVSHWVRLVGGRWAGRRG